MKLINTALLTSLATSAMFLMAPVQASGVNDTIKQALESKFDMTVESIQKTPYAELYEVVTDETILYTDAKASFIIAGSLVDTETFKDVTAERVKELSAVNFKDLPLDKAITWTKGQGTHKIVTFEDPNCTYCRRLYKELQAMDDITVYTFMLPILSADSRKKVTNIWCSENKYQTWNAWMANSKVPPTVEKCEEPTSELLELSRKLQVRGTPVILFENGERFNGYVPGETIKKTLAAEK